MMPPTDSVSQNAFDTLAVKTDANLASLFGSSGSTEPLACCL
jgi:hypothetical protein